MYQNVGMTSLTKSWKSAYLTIFIDDATITSEDAKIDKLMNDLHKEFNVRDLGEVSSFLGMQFDRDEKGLEISQSKIITHILTELNMEQCHEVATPMETNFHLTESNLSEEIPFCRLVYSLMYVSVTSRPDIAYSVLYLSRYLDRPTDQFGR
ncbi:uncharacterized protein [Centruroides vittatus]|uniref:uncharacterized protein n=1 Tax=Centruroides vittatus TaxID=120091 RepID=UPI003510397D